MDNKFDSQDFMSYVSTGGISKTLKRLEKDPCWQRAKVKAWKVFGLTALIYIPFSVLFCIVLTLSPTYGCLFPLLMMGSVPLYWRFILRPMVDRWYKR